MGSAGKMILFAAAFMLLFAGWWGVFHTNCFSHLSIGEKVDSLHGVAVYHNGPINSVHGRNLSSDGYNLGLKYQCVEFVKRYYFQHLHHRMPQSYGHAKDFFTAEVPDGRINRERGLLQFHNPGKTKPKADDILVFKESLFNRYGHVAIVSRVSNGEVEYVQQNAGPFGHSRKVVTLKKEERLWKIENNRIVGWLRKQ